MFVCDGAGKLTRRSVDLEDFHGAWGEIKRSQAINVAELEYLWFRFGRNQSSVLSRLVWVQDRRKGSTYDGFLYANDVRFWLF
jgi:hypothetical protein